MILPKTVAKACKPLGKLIFGVKKHAPKILLALGIAGYGGSVYFATKAGDKAKEAQKEYLKDKNKKKFIKGYVKAWGPTVGLFAVSTASVVGGHNILHKRYIATGVALEATRRAFEKYRERVIAKEGTDADICYRNGFAEKINLVGGEEGTPAEVVHEIVQQEKLDPHDYYIWVVDSKCTAFNSQDLHGTLLNLRRIRAELNCMLKASIDDRLTLREALIRTGFRSALANDENLARFAGRVGWKWGSEKGDNYISFGPMFDKIIDDPRDYYMGRTPPLIIEFNCDGDIYS